MKKRVLSALLALCLTLSLAGAAFAENEPSGDSSSAVSQAVSSVESEPQTQDETVSSDSASDEDQTAAKTESTPAPTETPAASDVAEEEPESTVAPEATEEPEVTAEPDATPTPTEDPVADVTENEESDGSVEYTAALEADGETMNVIVTAPEGAFAEGVQPKLSVTMLTAEDELNAVADKLDTAEVQYDGFAALDITFTDEATGEEVEPVKSVTVRIELPQAIVDSDIDLTTLAVQHLEEDENGNVQKVTEVATLDNGITLSEEPSAAVNEAAGVAPMSDMPAEEATAGDAAETPAAVAEFDVDGFSKFTITWYISGYYNPQVTVYYVDQSGNEITGKQTGDIPASNREWVNLEPYASEIEGYTFADAHLDSYNGTSAKWVRYNSNWSRFEYSTSTTEPKNNGTEWKGSYDNHYKYYRVYLVYTKNIEEVDTVDSTAKGVHMYMFNYNYPAFSKSIAPYNQDGVDGKTKEGYASLTTNADGWPNLKATVGSGHGATTNPSFRTFFGNVDNAFDLNGDLVLPGSKFWNGDRSDNSKHYLQYEGQKVNHLFLKDKFDEDGTFYYSSFENFATLKNDSDNNFTVYDALGTPSGENQYYFKRGNFMPYNTLNTSYVPWQNLYSETGTELKPGDPGYKDPVYGLNGEADFYFGMYVWADFYQPKDGLVESNDGISSKEMVFEFTGDDDMWVYIDGVLVLDLGGIHDAQSGSINFATGEITWTSTPKNDHTNPGKYQKTSTLLEKYEAAKAADKVDWDGDTFADGSNHRIQIFYMERGDGASNLKISFNLKTIPDGQFSVRKDVENYYAPQMADIEYTMQAYVDGQTYANQKYTLFEKEGGGTTDADGKFKIKADETAVFTDLTVGNKITVKEVGCSELPSGVNVDQAYEISYTVTDGSGQTVDGGEDNKQITATMPGYGSINVVVTNTATFTRPLKIVKNFSGTEGNTAPEGFQATYTLYEVSDGGKETAIGSIRYSDMEKADDGESASYIFWLETGKKYTVKETFTSENDSDGGTPELPWQSCTVTASIPASGTEASEGIVELTTSDVTSEDAPNLKTITLTNVYGQVKNDLSITKAVSGGGITSSSVSDQTFTFTVTAGSGVDTELLSGTFQVTGGEATSVSFTQTNGVYSAQVSITGTGTLTIKDLPIGTYTISEAQPGDLDDYYYDSNSLETGDDKATVSATTAGSIKVTNYYKPYKSLTLEKQAIGGMADVNNDTFNFTIQKTNGNLNEGDVVKNSGDTETKVDAPSGNQISVTMKSGGQVTINKLKETDIVTITENLAEDSDYKVKEIEMPDSDAFSQTNNFVTITVAKDTGTQKNLGNVKFVNEHKVVAPTGLEDNHTKPFGLMVGVAVMAGLALAGGAVVRRRRRWME